MADQKISELTALTGANVADDDAIAIVDTSATETKKIVFSELKNALDTATGFVRITGDTMTGALTTTGLTVDGASDGQLQVSADGQFAGAFNRKTSDGTILDLRKDGTTVGSIASGFSGTRLNIGSGNVGLSFVGQADKIYPYDIDAAANNDGTTNLGDTFARFKDLYLSGGVYLGGTGSANKLDDYEEGTFTPAFRSVTAPTYTDQTGSYTKVGRLVHVSISISYSSLDTSDGSSLSINLPFTASQSGAFHIVESSTNTGWAGSNTISLIGSIGAGAAALTFGSTGNYNDGDYDSGNFSASGVLRFAGIYPAS